MSDNNKYTAVTFSIGGCFIIIGFSFALAATLSLMAGALDRFIEYLIIASVIGMIGFYNAYRAIQEPVRKNQEGQ
jgi:UDP-N-acetylmuramyl pentapeptide phosphotransferase/UDP-N-acetylglucosamine-1-phosphate transferase